MKASNVLKINEPESVITPSDVTALAFRSVLLQSSFNYQRMQAGGWTWALFPYLKKIYAKEPDKLKTAMKDHLEFINTNCTTVGFLMGLTLSLEENNEDRKTINGLKVALFGPLAGIGDAIFWFTVLPIVAGICASFALQGSIIGPLLFFLVYCGIFLTRILWTRLGYNLGVKALDKLNTHSKAISKAASILGVTVIGGLIAAYVHITLLTAFPVGTDKVISLQTDFLDKILPNLLPMAYTLLMFFMLRKKKVSPTVLILMTFVGAIVFSFVGVL